MCVSLSLSQNTITRLCSRDLMVLEKGWEMNNNLFTPVLFFGCLFFCLFGFFAPWTLCLQLRKRFCVYLKEVYKDRCLQWSSSCWGLKPCISNCPGAESFGVLEKDPLRQLQKALLMWGLCVKYDFYFYLCQSWVVTWGVSLCLVSQMSKILQITCCTNKNIKERETCVTS